MDAFKRTILAQIHLNRQRTPTERMLAVCDLLDAVNALAPQDQDSIERRRRVEVARNTQRERWRAKLRQFITEHRSDAASGV